MHNIYPSPRRKPIKTWILAAGLMIAALGVIAHAELTTGTVSATVHEVVSVSGITLSVAEGSGSASFTNVITIDCTTTPALDQNDTMRVQYELVLSDPAIFDLFSSLTVNLIDSATGTTNATLTLDSPTAIDSTSCPFPAANKSYNANIVYNAARRGSANIQLGARLTSVTRVA